MILETKYHFENQGQHQYYNDVKNYLTEPIRLPFERSFFGINLANVEPRNLRRAVLQSFAETLTLDFPYINTLKSVRLKSGQYQRLQDMHNLNIIMSGIWVPVSYVLPLNPGDGSRVSVDVGKVVIKSYSGLSIGDFEGAELRKSEFRKEFKEKKSFNPKDSYPFTIISLVR